MMDIKLNESHMRRNSNAEIPTPIRIGSKSVVNRSDDLVHSLHVALARIEFCVEKEYPLDHLPVSLLSVGKVAIVH